ncbi:MAG: ribonuclease HII [Anaerolineae bacterium]|nr:ribonuclease HII [Anaerolineae bacterium]
MKSKSRKTANLLHERQYFAYGCRHIVGLDEAGRGAWAGPVAAGAVCLPIEKPDLHKLMRGVNDSKQLSPLQRQHLVETIKTHALTWGVGSASSQEIDAHGIVPATMQAMQRALYDALARTPGLAVDTLFIDAMLLPELRQFQQVSIIGGDARSLSIAAASILAKVWRDDHMSQLDLNYPGYGFAEHKGYGVPQHSAALKHSGPCPVHRLTFKPVRAFLTEADDA